MIIVQRQWGELFDLIAIERAGRVNIPLSTGLFQYLSALFGSTRLMEMVSCVIVPGQFNTALLCQPLAGVLTSGQGI